MKWRAEHPTNMTLIGLTLFSILIFYVHVARRVRQVAVYPQEVCSEEPQNI